MMRLKPKSMVELQTDTSSFYCYCTLREHTLLAVHRRHTLVSVCPHRIIALDDLILLVGSIPTLQLFCCDYVSYSLTIN